MNRAKQQELKIAYQRVMEVTVLDLKAPLRWIDDYVAENVCGHGTAADEKFNSRDEYRWVVINSRKQSKNISFKAKISTKYKPRFFGDHTAAFRDEVVVNIGSNKQVHVLQMLVGTSFSYIDNKWQLVSLNASLPDDNTSSTDTFHIADNEKKLRALEQTIEERTAEILEKNKELQIETALEKVRAVAMGMKKADDMLSICKTISQQLAYLGVNEIRNVQTAIFYQDRGTYMNYEYYLKHDKTFITEVDFKNHKIQLAFAKKMLKGPNEEMQEQMNGKKLQDWYTYQKSTNQFADKYILKAHSLNYYWYSLGPVALGISTYFPLTNDETNLFKRFLKVFELAYRRYLDIEKAEAQAREAQIEVALERVRSRSLAMHKSEEIMDVATIVTQQLQSLQLEFDSYTILIIDDKKMEYWIANQSKTYRTKLIEVFDHSNPSIPNKVFFSNYKAQTDFTRCYTYKEKNEHWKALFRNQPDFKAIPKDRKDFILKQPCYNIAVSFKQNVGSVFVRYNSKEYSIQDKEILKRFNEVFSQAYIRFLDLQKAEAQARESQIEASLERVRSHTMGLRKSDELEKVMGVIFEEFTKLGLDVYESGIYLRKDKSREFSVWGKSILEDGFFTNYDFPFVDHPILNHVMSNLENQKEYAIFNLHGAELTSYTKMMFSLDHFKTVLPETKAAYLSLENIYVAHAYFQHGFLEISGLSPIAIDMVEVARKFTQVIDLAYTRFLDIKKAEEQAREAQIEVSLERVRSKTMAMHNSIDVSSATATMFDELEKLGVENIRGGITIIKPDETQEVWSITNQPDGTSIRAVGVLDMKLHPFWRDLFKAWKNKDSFLLYQLKGKDKEHYIKIINNTPNYLTQPIKKIPDGYTQSYIFSEGAVWANSIKPHSEADKQIMKRFASVFSLTFRRYQDLLKAEAQAREAQIEAALEKVRSVAMSMHHSNELLSICEAIYVELLKLNITELRNTMINIHNDADETFLNYDYSAYAGKAVTKYGYHIHPIISQLVMQCRSTHDAFLDIALAGEEFETWRSFRKSSGEKDDKRLNSINHLHYYFYSIGIGSIGISTFESIDNEKLSLLKRFRNVFQLAYQRFTDLLAAETQAREAQIESSLERVRSKTMAMHNSDDVGETVATLFDELVKLGVHTNRCGILICGESKTHVEVWTAKSNPDGNATLITGQLDLNMHPLIEGFYRSWKKKKEVFTYTLKGDDIKSYYKAINNSKYYPIRFNLKKLPEQEVQTDFYFSDGAIFAFSPLPINEEAATIFKRFANVFGQTYRRFLDLQKAEAQAREAQIEAALERVRSKSMGMQKSSDLLEVIKTITDQLIFLEIDFEGSDFVTVNPDKSWLMWICSVTEKTPFLIHIPHFNHRGFEQYDEVKRKKLDFFSYVYSLEENASWMKHFFEKAIPQTALPEFSNERMEQLMQPTCQAASVYIFDRIMLAIYRLTDRPFTDVENAIFKRVGKVFEQAYTRFLDLQKAEANALEALRSASLDRVRAEIASMRTTADLEKITPIIWKELTVLNIPFVRCGVFIMDEQEEMIHTFLSTPDGKAIASLHLPYESTPLVNSIESWRAKKIYQTHWGLDTYAAFAKAIANEGSVINTEHYLSSVPKEGIHLHLLPFLQGMLYVGNTEPLSADNLSIIQSVADAFSTAYARYEDFIKLEDAKKQIENTLTDLQAAQKQLIQSEKMASLGELTAGIAHEIQNPLNFVNNFSEVSTELVDEMNEEIEKGNIVDAKEIANDLKQNLEKINHHGKRAGDIVKGMLQHSRSSSGVKEPTDINALADEYLRLAYHGLRAKDKSFNATMKTDFDESIGKVNVIPQDIGRVVLNLITNAFYVVNEKKQSGIKNYEPTVWVTTKLITPPSGGRGVLVSVKDNGNGIPPKILDKIFQPFFTTKPTGQGTGLGLSLSYDIVKAHGGELKVETKEGEGTSFIIQIPA